MPKSFKMPVPGQCPFCGGMQTRLEHIGRVDSKFSGFTIGCEGCGARGPTASGRITATEKWNERAPQRPNEE